ncbi:hypothetical protein PBI_MYXUS_92 [Mycobacterium phage Myxus]|uniref:Uncharacterized protein n=6 Tax=Fromanvirus packman TaxID=1034142 RepID=G1BR93_9CAUD|nr:hypothetical protein BJD80_gp017 [Mycobacterium phage Catalina]YP_009636057.1 hypothetical protein FGG56_gp16 [Mycobacterium phage PackMan]AMO43960.1 hypothetical protein PBI_MYXUS_92 [Mycobacterium phage Myxus]AOQ29049.1 hypothetical protein SEA_HORTUMSL17_93 [Mycobacterium phage HortumSL17]AOY12012.1 hypothetical protein SEA_PHAEDER_92 [Mycobacterium phage Phaeder]QDF20194.1 hypothetical protein SEA_TUBS_92 [Mycobacterium phage Tubs]QGH80551.1 hypothetical protein SEA_ALITER_85 [Mycobact
MSFQCAVCMTLGDERSFSYSDYYCDQHYDPDAVPPWASQLKPII